MTFPPPETLLKFFRSQQFVRLNAVLVEFVLLWEVKSNAFVNQDGLEPPVTKVSP